MNFLIQDVRIGLRTLLKSPGFTGIAILTLALGIGANTAIFSILNALLFRPLPMVDQPSQIVILANSDDHMEFPHGLSYMDYRDYRVQNDVFEELAIYTPLPVSLSGEGRAERTWGLFVSGGYFDVFGTEPLHGSSLNYDDTNPTGGEPLLVLGYTFWQRNYGGNTSIIGKTLDVNGVAFTVGGVMPEGFNGNETIFDIGVYLPMTTIKMIRSDDLGGLFESRESHIFRGVARLKEGVDAESAGTSMQLLVNRLGEEYPDTNADITLIVVLEKNARPEPSTYGIMQPVAIAFMALVSLVLFIACANVANLLLARGASRGRELATRAALGAGRLRIIRQLLTETLLLALFGGAVGILIAEWASTFVTSIANNLPVDIPINFDFRPDIRVYAFAFTAAVLSCVVAGLIPALQTSRINLQDALRDGRSSASQGRHRIRKVLVVSQLAISLLLLICAGLFMQSLGNAKTMDMGFQRGNLLLMSVDPITQGYDEARARQLFEEMVTRVEGLPGVQSASIGGFIPFSGSGLQGANVFPVASEQVVDDDGVTVFYNCVDHRYFQTMGVPLQQGRGFTDQDTADSPAVVIVNETLARQLWPGEDALGKQIHFNEIDGPVSEVVGVVRDGKYMLLAEDPRPFMYRPLTQDYPSLMASLHVRTEVDPMSLAPTVRQAVQAIDEHLPIFDVKNMETHLTTGNALMPFRLGAMMVGAFGMLGVVLATIGIYGVIAYSVTSRTHEFGVRMALGASGRDVLRLVIREGLWLTIFGLLVGLLFSVLVTPKLSMMLLDVNPLDVMLYGFISLFLALVALLACFIPAHRATKVDPMVALRCE